MDKLFQQAFQLHQQGQLQQAECLYQQVLTEQPHHIDALHFYGVLHHQLGRDEQAVNLIRQSLQLAPSNSSAYGNLGLALHELQRYEEALDSYDKAIAVNAHNVEAWFNRGNALLALLRYEAALASYDKTLSLRANYIEALSNRGTVLRELKRYAEALDNYQRILQLKPDSAEAEFCCGVILKDLKQLPKAIAHFERALALKPDMDTVFGTCLQTKMEVCDWQDFEQQRNALIAGIEQGKHLSVPFTVHALTAALAVQQQAAKLYNQAKFSNVLTLPVIAKHKHSKIKLAYFSSDFCHHPVAYLTARLFALHDRSRFEVLAFSSTDKKDAIQQQLASVFDQFIDISQMDDEQVVQLARQLELDIAVDLNGFTEGCRSRLFAMRVAPIQISYIGYLGTMSADYMDYLIADSVLIPVEHQPYYSEKIIYLPNSFQVNDNTLVIANTQYQRADFGLPKQGVVFCCFNGIYKISPTVFKTWLRILKAVKHSVLWISTEQSTAIDHLRHTAKLAGIEPERLIFTGNIPLTEHLARQKLADLFLDTSPYNAGATASAALWAGLPVLTFLGTSFSSRMGASLLTAVGLPELIADDLAHYETLAIALGNQPERLQALKTKLAANRLTQPLFNTELFTQHLEQAYQQVYDRYQQGLTPAHIFVAETQSETTELDALIDEGNALEDANDLVVALAKYDAAIAQNANYARAYSNRGNVLQSLGRLDEAVASYDKALAIKPDYAEALYNRGNALHALQRLPEALECYQRATQLKPDFILAWLTQASLLQMLERPEAALSCYDHALKIDDDAEIHWQRAMLLHRLARYDDALADYQRVLATEPQTVDVWLAQAQTLRAMQRTDEAVQSYQQALTLAPNRADIQLLYARLLQSLKRYDAALASCQTVLQAEPEHLPALICKGTILQDLQQAQAAIACYDEVLRLEPNHVETLIYRALVQQANQQLLPAIADYQRAFAIQPDAEYLLGSLLHAKMKVCDWQDFEHYRQLLEQGIAQGKNVSIPFPVLAITASAHLQKRVAEIYTLAKHPSRVLAPALTIHRHKKIKVGYFSSDFRHHPTTYLMAELFKRHDRSRFEIIALSFAKTKDDLNQQLISAFDLFVDISEQSDAQAVRVARDLELDIAVDVNGFTDGYRANLFAMRVAPIQVSYLAYPSTMGAAYMDYLIADPVLIPESHRKFYTEKIAYLPNSYQVNDSRRVIADTLYTRKLCGLPETGFVFCCFNNNYKILPETFASWMRILSSVKGSVLWLLEDNAIAAENLRQQAMAHGIAQERLIFAKRLPLAAHLARHRVADLCLDTLPYNAHTTASDALWAAVPVLTCTGETFASRVAASLLTAIALPELITDNSKAFEALAIELATQPKKLRAIKDKLAKHRLTTPLFDTALFTQQLEALYQLMVDRAQQGLAPDHLSITTVRIAKTPEKKPSRLQTLMQKITGLGRKTPKANAEEVAALTAQLEQAQRLQRQGQFAAAEVLYREILAKQPEHKAALQGLRAIERQIVHKSQFINTPKTPTPTIEPPKPKNVAREIKKLMIQGQLFQQYQPLSEALVRYDAVLALEPRHLEALIQRGNVLEDLERFAEALASYDLAIQYHSESARAYSNRGNVLQSLKRVEEAISSYDRAIALKPDYAAAFFNRANALVTLKCYQAAIADYDLALSLDAEFAEARQGRSHALLKLAELKPASPEQQLAKANTRNIQKCLIQGSILQHQQKLPAALARYQALLELDAQHLDGLIHCGNVLEDLGRVTEALASYDLAIQYHPESARAYSNRGNVLQTLTRFEEAIASYDKAIALNPDYAGAFYNRANALQALKRHTAAIKDYQQALDLEPDFLEAMLGHGNALHDAGQAEAALADYERILAVQPNYLQAWYNQGNVLLDLGRINQALSSYQRALSLDENHADALIGCAVAYQELKQFDVALNHYQRAIALKEDAGLSFGDCLYMKLNVCDWQDLDVQIQRLVEGIARGEQLISPFILSALVDDPKLQLQAARTYALSNFNLNNTFNSPVKALNDKITLAYVSSDFRHHPVSYLIAELIERHDRKRFHVIGFSLYKGKERDEVQARLAQAFDEFIDVSALSTSELIALVRSKHCDIAIDLNGYTKGNRTDMFAARIAPIQVCYLGYLGTMGAAFMDYLLADAVLIPKHYESCYSEKIVYLPNSFQVNDSTLTIANNSLSRADFGLPEHGFVFCCFNNSHKITEPVFAVWLHLLQQIAHSVLWLTCEQDSTKQRLRAHAQQRGIAPERLIFANRVPMPEHLARHRLANLFLDTSPYNAGATASAALWAGLPVLTYLGQSFAARMGASLLTALGLPELITDNLEHYQARALELASQPEQLAQLKAKLAQQRLIAPLFDTALFTQQLETAYQYMVQRQRQGLAPEHIRVANLLAEPNADELEELIKQGNDLEDNGQLAEALACYDLALSVDNHYPRAHSNRGNVLQLLNRFDEAVSCYERAIALKPDYAGAFYNLGNALVELNRLSEAKTQYQQALSLEPDFIDALIALGNIDYDEKHYAVALSHYESALKLEPHYPQALANRGNALRQLKRWSEALACYDQALSLDNDCVAVLFNRAIVLHDLKRDAEALHDYDQVLRINAQHIEALLNRSALLMDLKRLNEAQADCQRLLSLEPKHLAAHCQLISIFKEQGLWNLANQHLTLALTELPDSVELHILQLMMTVPIYADNVTVAAGYLTQFDQQLDTLATWLNADSARRNALYDLSSFASSFFLAYQTGNHHQRLTRYGDLISPPAQPLTRTSKTGKLRLAIVSHHFRRHSVWDVITHGLLNELNRAQFEVYLYYLDKIADEQTALAKSLADVWRDEQDYQDFASCLVVLQQDAPDVILYPEIGMGPLAAKLATLRLAPLQIVSWGHPLTSGLPTIDWYLSGELLESPNADSHYRERLIRLPNTGCCTTAMNIAAQALTPEVLAKLNSKTGIRFLNAQTVFKFHPSNDVLYAEIARAVPDSVFVLLREDKYGWAMDNIIARLTRTFNEYGLDLQQHLVLLPWLSLPEFQSLLEVCDVYLDCPSFSGYTTALQVLQQGLPLLTLEGEFMRQRLAAGLLRHCGLQDMIASSNDDYVAKAAQLAEECRNGQAAKRRANILHAVTKAHHDVSVVRAFEQQLLNAFKPKTINISAEEQQALDALILRGNDLEDQQQFLAALACYDAAIQHNGDYARAHSNRGNVLQCLERFDEALAAYNQAIALKPDYAGAFFNRGNVLHQLKRLPAAIASYQLAITHDAQFIEAFISHGNALYDYGLQHIAEERQRLFNLALDNYQQALNLDPHCVAALFNRAILLSDAQRFSAAISDYEQALALRPDYAEARFNLSLTQLLLGDFAHGWRNYECRWQTAQFAAMRYSYTQPLWLGDSDLQGKTILLHAEQGYGDTLQFCRYAPLVKQLGANVVLTVPSALKALLQTLQGVDVLLSNDETPPAFDVHCPLMSLPLAFHTELNTIPSTVPYLFADAKKVEHWHKLLGETNQVRIGVSWSGNPNNGLNHRRSVPLSQFKQLFEHNAQFICLQTDVSPADKAILANYHNVLLPELHDFSDTAALCQVLDVIISVDTSIAHLAGALANPVWLLLCSDWRYLLNRDDSPWYANTRLFRQSSLGDWQSVLTAISEQLHSQFQLSTTTVISSTNTGALFQQAFALHQQGELIRAKALYQHVLALNPQHLDTLHFLGVLHYQQQEFDQAAQFIESALQLEPNNVAALANLAMVLKDANRLSDAVVCYEKILQYQPKDSAALFNIASLLLADQHTEQALSYYDALLAIDANHIEALLQRGTALQLLNRFEEALDNYQRLLALQPNHAEALFGLTNVYFRLQQPELALDSYEQSLAANPNAVETLFNQGVVLESLKRFDAAMACYQAVLNLKPDYVAALNNIGAIFNKQQRYQEAVASYRKAIALKPDCATAYCNLITLQKEQGWLDEVQQTLTLALSVLPDDVDLRFIQLISTLPTVAKDAETSALAVTAFEQQLTALEDWAKDSKHQQALQHASLLPLPFMLAYRAGNHVQRLSRFGDLISVASDKLPAKKQSGKLKLAVVSHHFHNHSVWVIITRGFLANLDRSRFELLLYYMGDIEDEETKFAKSLADVWCNAHNRNDLNAWLLTLKQDAPDIIFYPEIGMDPTSARLAGHRLAPLQVASWGHPMTTGLASIDLYFSGELLESKSADSHYRERLIRLPDTGCCTTPMPLTAKPLASEVMALLNQQSGARFVIAQMVYKFEPADDSLYAEIAKAMPNSVFILLRDRKEGWAMDQIIARLQKTFVQHGVDPHRLVLLPWQLLEEFQTLLDMCDVYLDCPSFSGYTTAWQAVHRGMPIVTLEGEFMRQRLAAGLLRKIGQADSVAEHRQDYINKAVKLATESLNPLQRSARRAAIKAAAVKADNDVHVVKAFEQTLLETWHRL